MARARRHVEVFRVPVRRRATKDHGARIEHAWYFRLVHANGHKGDRSAQPYVSAWSAKRGASRAHPGLPVEVQT